MLTLGTGIGTAIFHRGKLLPNTEFGHLEMNGKDAEARASDYARQRDDLSWKKYAKRLNRYLARWKNYSGLIFLLSAGGSAKNMKNSCRC